MSTRADLLQSNLTPIKEWLILGDLCAYRRCAALLAREQWRLFFVAGRFNRQHDIDKSTFAAIAGSAARVQMCRYQVVGMLRSWVSNRGNDFRDAVTGSSLPPDTRHMLHTINVKQAWFVGEPVEYGKGKKRRVIPGEVRKLARSIMHGVMRRHRRPGCKHICMLLDQREAQLRLPDKASQRDRVAWWVRFILRRGAAQGTVQVDVPLLDNPQHARRQGEVNLSVMVAQDRRTGRLKFGVTTDQSQHFADTRAAYQPKCESLPLDFGLNTLFATSEGDLLGRGWKARLLTYDAKITAIAKGMQKNGRKPRESRRYRVAIAALRGFIKTEVNRVLNRIVALHRPAELALERLDFRNPELSKRLNRIIQNCGRSVIKTKLADLADRFGVENVEVNPAYTSQTCSQPGCGYVDRRNRKGSVFRCLWCGHEMHADVNAARNIAECRALATDSVFQTEAAILAEIVHRFGGWTRERFTGEHGSTADPRLTNPHFRRRDRRGADVGIAYQCQ